jgi:hydrogenase-4 component B
VTRAAGVVRGVSYRGSVPHHLDDVVYRPVRRAALAVAAQARRLQTGRLGTYVAYLVVLVVALLAAARLGLLG